MAKPNQGGAQPGGAAPDPHATPGKTTGHDGVDHLLQILREVFKLDVDAETFSGVLQPHALDGLIKKSVTAAQKVYKVQHGSLRDTLVNYGLALASSRIDAVAGSLSTPLRVTARVLSDFVSGFRAGLFGKETVAELEKKVLSQAQVACDKGDAALADDAVQMILEAAVDDPVEAARVEAILNGRDEMWAKRKARILKSEEKPQEKKKHGESLLKKLTKVAKAADAQIAVFNAAATPKVAELKSAAEAAWAASRPPTARGRRYNIGYWFGQLLELPWKILGLLWK